ncbi:potassium channel family protein [Rhodococcus indonesiensis]|uniref:Potassium channel family protein n=1 Tax=Rhodococcus indonesiensis TaxID=3055869 RepID=A0ABT7RTL6_9NOCA|nr:potassium channel family protein [Rhodococcus indonesiensis]MDM7490985.1 potassium channel family protein [Rhodococcus indonesiensis]
MADIMIWISSMVGAALIVGALRDIFVTLWHPRGLGTICRGVFVVLWRGAHYLGRRRRLLGSVGPVGLVVTVGVWATMIVLGWALIYLPHMPDGFYFASALRPSAASDPVMALYLSLVTVGTLGFGDITPAYPALRLLIPLQALMGFVLFTAAISWVLQIYPALSRRRATARRLVLLAATGTEQILPAAEASIAVQWLDSVTEALTTSELDLMQYGETYFFRESDADLSLAAALSYAPRLAAAGAGSSAIEVRRAAAILDEQTRRLARRLDTAFLHTGGTVDEICERFAADHRHQPVSTT